jgi:hypothetical protein
MTTARSLWPTLLDQVEHSDGVLKVSIEFLRQIAGAQRMGPKIADKIEAGLDVQGLRAFPTDLNRKQHEEVILVKAGTPAYEAIQAISAGDPNDSLVSLLTRLNLASEDPRDALNQQVRALAEKIVDPVSELLGITRPQAAEPSSEEDVQIRADRRHQAVQEALADVVSLPSSG